MQTRWKCPNGCGGVLAPTRPRKDDVRRYCLPCSKKTGRLVERFSPAMEKKRQKRAQVSKEKTKKKAEKAREAERESYTVEGVDMRKELKRVVRLPVFGGPKGKLAKRPPHLEVKNGLRGGMLGLAYGYSNRIEISKNQRGYGPKIAKDTLIHEVAHIYVDRVMGRDTSTHGPTFNKIYRQAYYEYFKEHAPGSATGPWRNTQDRWCIA
jgi:hypothetical protein